MKSLFDMWCSLTENVGQLCDASTKRDLNKAALRFKHEGSSFLTITLPTFAKGLEQALERGKAGPDLWPRWACRGSTPRFLGEMLDNVFDRESGVLLDEPDVDSIWGMRQISLYMSKIELPCSDARNARAAKAYVECEKEVREADESRSSSDVDSLSRVFTLLFGDVLSAIDLQVYCGELVPRHGSGATADRLLGNEKFDVKQWTTRLERYFPYGEYAIPNWRYYYRLDQIDFLEPGAERPVRVVFVPKTLKTPRVIAIEPTCMQFVQQAVMQSLVPRLESSWIGPMIGFLDQVPNRRMAQQASLDGSLATLDLSEASDRVSNQLVNHLLRHWPHLQGAVQACRSTHADVPGTGVIPLAKFASMGSALTFPLEAMVFLSIAIWSMSGREKCLTHLPSRSAVKRLIGRVRVYGDDIVVPAAQAQCVSAGLEANGLKVNGRKSFWNGKFRESCGGDYYAGIDVSVVKVRRPWPKTLKARRSAAEIESAVALRNLLYEGGLWKAAARLDQKLSVLLRGHFPYVGRDSVALGRYSFLGYDSQRECPRHHAPLVRAWVSASKPPLSEISGEGALLKCLLNTGLPMEKGHLRRSGRPKSTAVKLRWVRPF